MLIFDQLNKGERPLRLLAWAVFGGLLLLAFGLWRIQILNGPRYREIQQVQSFRSIRIPAVRGRILDRDGRVLADTRPHYRLDLYLDELKLQFETEHRRLRKAALAARGVVNIPTPGFWARLAARFQRAKLATPLTVNENEQLRRQARYLVVSNLMANAGARLGVNVSYSETNVYRHWYHQRYLPFPVVDHLTATQVAIIVEQGWNYPGLALEQVPTRNYPEGRTAAHIIGLVRREDTAEPDEPDYDYRLPDFRGKKGLEYRYDSELRGEAGAKSILVNSGGYRVGEFSFADSVPGQTVVTTLDLRLQKECENSLNQVSGEERGAVVVLDCRNGDVLALASAPAFDPNLFVSRLPDLEYARLQDPVMRPMINRATDEIYAPGSTFKVFTSLALMEAGIPLDPEFEVKPDPTRPGKGAFFLGTRKIGDTASPGIYDFHRAFIKSSNSYFIYHAQLLGLKRFLEFGHRFNFGEPTGLKVSQDKPGIFPKFGETLPNGQTWNARNVGVLADASIGQQINVTPLQLALAYAAVANGGTLFYPRLVDRLEPADVLSDQATAQVRPGQVRSKLAFRADHLSRVHAAMRDDVADSAGSGVRARVTGFEVCGKTGTAEIKGNGVKDSVTWFASFAPYGSPRYVVIVMVESGRSGGGTCAPVAQRIYQFLHDRETGGRPVAATTTGREN